MRSCRLPPVLRERNRHTHVASPSGLVDAAALAPGELRASAVRACGGLVGLRCQLLGYHALEIGGKCDTFSSQVSHFASCRIMSSMRDLLQVGFLVEPDCRVTP
jgi:hypothetical protein